MKILSDFCFRCQGTVGVGLSEAPPEVPGGTQGTGGATVVGPGDPIVEVEIFHIGR